MSYRAVELSGTVVNQLPPPGTGTFYSTVTTLLIPQGGAAPAMVLVVVVKGTLAPDGTVSNEVVQTYLVCRSRGTGRATSRTDRSRDRQSRKGPGRFPAPSWVYAATSVTPQPSAPPRRR